MARVVVVGAGIAGLTAAYLLRDHDVTVIDGANRLGGKLRTSEVAGMPVDEGAEQLLVRRPEAVSLARELGLGDELVNPTTSSAWVWARGRLRPLPSRTMMGVPSSARSVSGVLAPLEVARVGLDRVLPGKAPVDDVSVASYVGRRMGAAVVDRLVEPLLGGVYAGRAQLLSLHATMPQLPRVNGSLMSAVADAVPPPTEGAVFAAMPGGMSRLVDALERAAAATVVRGRLVRRIERVDGGYRIVHGATTDERAEHADAIVVATPATTAARLLDDVAPAAVADLAAIDYASVAIITLAFAAGDWPATSGSGYLVPALPGRPVKAVTFSSQKWPHLRGDVVIVRASIGRYGDVTDLQRDDDELAGAVRTELRDTLGVTTEPVAHRVSRWGGGLPQYTVGHLDRVRRIRAAVGDVPGLAVCGAAYDGVGVPATIASARLAVESLGLTTRRS